MISLRELSTFMFLRFFSLQWKSFRRSAAFSSGVITGVFYVFGGLYFAAIFTILGFGSYFILDDDMGVEPLSFINKHLIYACG